MCLDRFTQAQIRKADTLKRILFVSVGILITILLFEIGIVQLYTFARNTGREIRSHQTSLQQSLTCVTKFVSLYYLDKRDVSTELSKEEGNILIQHHYLMVNSISQNALKITKSGDQQYRYIVSEIDLIIKTHPEYKSSEFENMLESITTYSTTLSKAFSIYTQILEQNNTQQSVFLYIITSIEVGIIVLLLRFNILPAFNSLLGSIFNYVELQANADAERRRHEELVKELPRQMFGDIRVDVAQIGKDVYQVVGQDRTYTVRYEHGEFICYSPACSIFEHMGTCLHTRRARWFRSRLESSTELQTLR
jgi:hypothetical protein